MAERAAMPAFVPRTVASFERAATVVARRVAAPVRTLAGRALSFADRLVGMWAAGPTVGGLDADARPALRAAGRGGGMPMPRPWYELVDGEAAVASAQARAIAAAPSAATPSPPTTVTPAAERGAAIERTTLTATPEVAAATQAATSLDRAPIEAGAATTSSPMTMPPATASTPMQPMTAASEDVRAAEALGLRRPMHAAVPAVARPVAVAPAIARAVTPLARALAHAAWVDAQLRTVAPSVEATPRATAGLVFVAPAEGERPIAAASSTTTTSPSVAPVTAAPSSARMPAAATTAPTAASAPTVRPAAASAVAPAASATAWSAALPDPRLPAAMPTAIARRVVDFIARLVGAQSERDATGSSVAAASAPAPYGIAATRPTLDAARAGVERTFVVVAPAVSWRPGAAAARLEQLGEHIDARAMLAWGAPPAMTGATPTSTARTTTVAADRRAHPTAIVLAPPTSRATDTRSVPSVARTLIAASPAPARVTGAARLAAFVQQLVGVQAARETAPLPVEATTARDAASAASARAPERVTLAAPQRTTPSTAQQRMPPAGAPTTVAAPGAIARRAEQLGGMVGVRAASLSIDFVDPSRLSLFTATSATPATASAAADTIMPVPRPLLGVAPAGSAEPSLTSEEWSLVATFPSAATAVQLAAARQSRQWGAPERTLLTASRAATAERGQVLRAQTVAMRGAAPGEYVAAALVAPSETQARLPGGRTPRGSFTWPKLAETTPSRTEWTAPATVTVAELAKQAAPGMPLWGALPPLVAVAPSLAARASAVDPAVLAPAGAVTTAAVALRDAAAVTTRDSAAGVTTREAAAVTTRDALPATADARGDAPAMTLMTAAATRDMRAAARTGARGDGVPGDRVGDGGTHGDGKRGDGARGDGMRGDTARTDGAVETRGGQGEVRSPAMPLTAGPGEPARGGGARAISSVRPVPAMPLMTTAAATKAPASAPVGPAARALELARPFLRLVEGGVTGSDGGPRASSAPRFFEQPQPLVAGAPASDSASRIVEALRAQPAASASGDDRVSLADLTLIAMASATQQVAASPAGGGPRSSSASSAPSPSSSSTAASERDGAGKSGNPAQEIEELARAAFDELQRLFAIARERSGEHG